MGFTKIDNIETIQSLAQIINEIIFSLDRDYDLFFFNKDKFLENGWYIAPIDELRLVFDPEIIELAFSCKENNQEETQKIFDHQYIAQDLLIDRFLALVLSNNPKLNTFFAVPGSIDMMLEGTLLPFEISLDFESIKLFLSQNVISDYFLFAPMPSLFWYIAFDWYDGFFIGTKSQINFVFDSDPDTIISRLDSVINKIKIKSDFNAYEKNLLKSLSSKCKEISFLVNLKENTQI